MRTLNALPKNGQKPISREALAKCVEAVTFDRTLADRIRVDNSFDVVIVSSALVNDMHVELFEFPGKVPLYGTYCGHAVQKAINQLPYGKKYEYPACIRINK